MYLIRQERQLKKLLFQIVCISYEDFWRVIRNVCESCR